MFGTKLIKIILRCFRYKRNCESAAKIFRDRPIKPLDEAVYWTEYVLRYNGAPQLRTKGSQLPWYQYYLIDVALVLLTASAIVLIIIYSLLMIVINLLFGKKPVKKHKKN